ncbi:MAG: hypothetical protein H6824_12375 [Planctomycetaceae bacterium]|nr:hypothetical protein [Planctomycetaceae bacterium]
MSWMITDHRELKGTCYMEVLPGQYGGKCWNGQSVYFEEEHFGFIEATIIRHCPKYDHCAFTEINKTTWEKILAELEDLYADIGDSSRLADVRSKVDLFFLNTEEQFLSSEAENMKRLREMLRDFTRWMRATLNMHDTVTVLGM